MEFIQNLLVTCTIASLALSVVFSLRSRRSKIPRTRGLNTARMNICMGIMLVLMALIQMVSFSGSTIRVIVGSLFLVLGLFNLFAGLRNHSTFRAMKQ
ncbi:hypothetical protein EBB07_01200 [Paenibacillaceae bacterium]|nr:hypothetical protein EBB07_01200 [Paenibacillaceae bacterium]